MRNDMVLAALVVALGGIGTWLLLPHRLGAAKPRIVHAVGGALVAIAAALLALSWTPPGPFLTSLFFYAFALGAVVAAVLMIASRSPVMSALWFAAVVLATSGLFLLAGASFLAAGTVIVYAGAIIVTFLFVIMLAQAGGQAAYDRATRMPARATLSCFLLMWMLVYCVQMVRQPAGFTRADTHAMAQRLVPTAALSSQVDLTTGNRLDAVLTQAVRPDTARFPHKAAPRPGEPRPDVAALGGTLYTDHLIAVEVAGALLFIALVGAAAIATPRPPVRPQSH